MLSPAARRAKLKAAICAVSGNFLEVYDYIIYGFYATYIAVVFFPTNSAFLSLMLSLTTFGIAAVARPFGAIFLGSYMDRKGRRAGLLLTLGLMAIGTVCITLMPGYAVAGIVAPLVLVSARLIQGFAFGVESAGVNIYLAEISTPGNRGFYVAWQAGSQGLTVMLAASIGVALAASFSTEQMASWGWRIPFLIGCLIIPMLFWLRSSLVETEVFLKSRHPRATGEVLRILVDHWPVVTIAMGMQIFATTTFYLITVYTPTFGDQALHLPPLGNLLVTFCVGLTIFIFIPIGGALSDRIGRMPLVVATPLLVMASVFPAMSWLVAAPSFSALLIVELWLSFLNAIFTGAVAPLIIEMMPEKARTSGTGLAISLANGVFGSFTPAISALLIETTGNRASPALWITCTGAIALLAALAVNRFAPASSRLDALA
jgi:MFS transporter, MHS family, citrate/tricarballylate:H+ symporter